MSNSAFSAFYAEEYHVAQYIYELLGHRINISSLRFFGQNLKEISILKTNYGFEDTLFMDMSSYNIPSSRKDCTTSLEKELYKRSSLIKEAYETQQRVLSESRYFVDNQLSEEAYFEDFKPYKTTMIARMNCENSDDLEYFEKYHLNELKELFEGQLILATDHVFSLSCQMPCPCTRPLILDILYMHIPTLKNFNIFSVENYGCHYHKQLFCKDLNGKSILEASTFKIQRKPAYVISFDNKATNIQTIIDCINDEASKNLRCIQICDTITKLTIVARVSNANQFTVNEVISIIIPSTFFDLNLFMTFYNKMDTISTKHSLSLIIDMFTFKLNETTDFPSKKCGIKNSSVYTPLNIFPDESPLFPSNSISDIEQNDEDSDVQSEDQDLSTMSLLTKSSSIQQSTLHGHHNANENYEYDIQIQHDDSTPLSSMGFSASYESNETNSSMQSSVPNDSSVHSNPSIESSSCQYDIPHDNTNEYAAAVLYENNMNLLNGSTSISCIPSSDVHTCMDSSSLSSTTSTCPMMKMKPRHSEESSMKRSTIRSDAHELFENLPVPPRNCLKKKTTSCMKKSVVQKKHQVKQMGTTNAHVSKNTIMSKKPKKSATPSCPLFSMQWSKEDQFTCDTAAEYTVIGDHSLSQDNSTCIESNTSNQQVLLNTSFDSIICEPSLPTANPSSCGTTNSSTSETGCIDRIKNNLVNTFSLTQEKKSSLYETTVPVSTSVPVTHTYNLRSCSKAIKKSVEIQNKKKNIHKNISSKARGRENLSKIMTQHKISHSKSTSKQVCSRSSSQLRNAKDDKKYDCFQACVHVPKKYKTSRVCVLPMMNSRKVSSDKSVPCNTNVGIQSNLLSGKTSNSSCTESNSNTFYYEMEYDESDISKNNQSSFGYSNTSVLLSKEEYEKISFGCFVDYDDI